MDNVILNYYSKITGLNVSRETCNELESLISMILEKNKFQVSIEISSYNLMMIQRPIVPMMLKIK